MPKINVNDIHEDFMYEHDCEFAEFNEKGQCIHQRDCKYEYVEVEEDEAPPICRSDKYYKCFDPEIRPREPIFAHVYGLTGDYLGVAHMESVTDLPKTDNEGTPYGWHDYHYLFGHPRLTFEDGSILYGCECWWHSVKERRNNKKLDLKPWREFMSALCEAYLENHNV